MHQAILQYGQDTIYFQKFDVENSDGKMYWHQYMQNIMAAQSEGARLKKTLTEIDGLDYNYTFIIPVYENMPNETTPRPNTTNTNIEVGTDLVKINVTNSLKMRNEPNGSSVVGYLYKGEIATRVEKATTKVNGTYWDKILKSNGVTGYVARCTYDHESQYKEYLISIGTEHSNEITTNTDTTGTENIEKNENSTVDNNSNNFGNGNSPDEIDDKNQVTKGDVNKDGRISPADYVLIKNHIIGIRILNDEEKNAADVNSDGKISPSDYVLVKNQILYGNQ